MTKQRFAVALLLTAGLSTGSQRARAQAPTPKLTRAEIPAFDVVSMRPSAQDGYLHTKISADGFQATHITLQQLIFFCYAREEGSREGEGIVIEKQVLGLPGWAENSYYDVTAKIDAQTVERFAKFSYRERGQFYQVMLRPVLKDRFKLALEEGSKQQPVYLLQVLPSGSRLMASSAAPDVSSYSSGNGQIRAKNYSTGELAAELSEALNRVVVDKTNLPGFYDYALKWRPDTAKEQDSDLPSIFTAMKEQLGLQLIAASSQVEVLTVTHVDLPAEN